MRRQQTLTRLFLFLGILIFLNILANARFGGRSLLGAIDMTEEQRFTLTKGTRAILADLDEVVYVQVLLEGEFPAGFKRLQTATRDMLEDFRGQSGYIEYEFVDPGQGTAEEINQLREQLAQEGIIPVNLRVKEKDGTAEKLTYPYAIINYKGRALPVNLLENEVPGMPREIILNNSVGLLEYKLANGIQKLQDPVKPNIVFTSGHGELSRYQTADLERSLREYYNTGRLNLDSIVAIDQRVSALVVAKPRGEFSEKDKFKIDQYVMNGGKVLWLIDALRIDLDSLQGRKEYVPVDYKLGLDDLLFKYGIRIQPNLVLDIQSSRIPLATGNMGSAAQFELFQYPYHPVIIPRSGHPVVKSLAPLNLQYPSTIDTTVRTKTPIQKTVLLESGENSRVQFIPVRMDFEFLRYDLEPEKFNKGPQPVAMLLEGQFPSMYENRVTEPMQAGLQELGMEYKEKSVFNRMVVVSDGDIARNEFRIENERVIPSPLGFNEFEKYQFANKDFLLNAIEYLLDERGVIEARSREVKLRLLDRTRAESEKQKWQLLNILLPLVFLLLFGIVYTFVRRRRFAR